MPSSHDSNNTHAFVADWLYLPQGWRTLVFIMQMKWKPLLFDWDAFCALGRRLPILLLSESGAFALLYALRNPANRSQRNERRQSIFYRFEILFFQLRRALASLCVCVGGGVGWLTGFKWPFCGYELDGTGVDSQLWSTLSVDKLMRCAPAKMADHQRRTVTSMSASQSKMQRTSCDYTSHSSLLSLWLTMVQL